MKWLQGFFVGARFLLALILERPRRDDVLRVSRGRRVVHERYFDDEGNVRWRPKGKNEEEEMECRK